MQTAALASDDNQNTRIFIQLGGGLFILKSDATVKDSSSYGTSWINIGGDSETKPGVQFGLSLL